MLPNNLGWIRREPQGQAGESPLVVLRAVAASSSWCQRSSRFHHARLTHGRTSVSTDSLRQYVASSKASQGATHEPLLNIDPFVQPDKPMKSFGLISGVSYPSVQMRPRGDVPIHMPTAVRPNGSGRSKCRNPSPSRAHDLSVSNLNVFL